MSTEATVMAWDTALRASKWETARSLLTDDHIARLEDFPTRQAALGARL